ncbi:MAG: cupredoxin family copper-binding protein [bacterium]|nr:cupredoxin family copper-binding protein [bacterium]
MNKNIIGAVLILAGIAIAVYNWGYKTAVTPSPVPPPAQMNIIPPTPPTGGIKPAPPPAGGPTPAPSSIKPQEPAFTSNIQVAVRGFGFVSETVRVKAGTKITWTNFDAAGHTVTSDTGLFASKILSQGKSFEYIFNTPGTYSYHCIPHPYMKGEIVVE